tara:strand:+ start:3870 stop:4829 length:960 start_codon:yes stop_codon:yes gene_type:complete
MDLLVQARVNFITSIFGPGIINQDSISVCCPSCCSDRPNKRKLVIKIDNGMHHCWICDLKGSSLKYTVRRFAPERYGEFLRIFNESDAKAQRVEDHFEKVALPKNFIPLGLNLNSLDPDVRDTVTYIFNRGLSERDIWYFKMGTCTTGRFRRRVILPSFDVEGELNYFTARSIDSVSQRKYLNSKAKKKNLIFNEINIDWKKELTLVEGPFDLVKCDKNTTALLGSAINESYLLFQKIVKNKTPLLIALDPDASDKIEEICKKFYSYGVDIRMLAIDPFADVGEMSKEEFLKRKKSAMPWRLEHRLYQLINKIKSGSLV